MFQSRIQTTWDLVSKECASWFERPILGGEYKASAGTSMRSMKAELNMQRYKINKIVLGSVQNLVKWLMSKQVRL